MLDRTTSQGRECAALEACRQEAFVGPLAKRAEMALHGGIARYAGSFGGRVVRDAATVYSSERPSPLLLPNVFSCKPNQRRRSIRSVFFFLTLDERAERRA